MSLAESLSLDPSMLAARIRRAFVGCYGMRSPGVDDAAATAKASC